MSAIQLIFGTETRGVDIPFVTPHFESNVRGVYIVGELGGMGLIRNAVVQGRQAVDHIAGSGKTAGEGELDVIVVGCGPAGLSASLAAKKHGLKFATIDRSDIGGSVLQYPRQKIVMTTPVDLPLYGKVRLKETTKEALLELWRQVIGKTGLSVRTHEKMKDLVSENGSFRVVTDKGEYRTRNVVLAIGRRGTPRRLGVPGEESSKVAYRLLEPDQHQNQDLLVVGGGDSAIEAAVALAGVSGNRVTLSYRGEAFARAKPANLERMNAAARTGSLTVALKSNVARIDESEVSLSVGEEIRRIPNHFVYIFAGGEAPNAFLQKIGVRIEKKFGTA